MSSWICKSESFLDFFSSRCRTFFSDLYCIHSHEHGASTKTLSKVSGNLSQITHPSWLITQTLNIPQRWRFDSRAFFLHWSISLEIKNQIFCPPSARGDKGGIFKELLYPSASLCSAPPLSKGGIPHINLSAIWTDFPHGAAHISKTWSHGWTHSTCTLKLAAISCT